MQELIDVSERHTNQVTFDELLSKFRKALSNRCTDSINTIWKGNPVLVSYLTGKSIEVLIFNATGHAVLQKKQISSEEWTTVFKSVLSSNKINFIKSFWEKSPVFASYFSGNSIEVSVVNADVQAALQKRQISVDELVVNFKAALTGQCSSVIDSMWNDSPRLAPYFSGMPLEVSDANGDRQAVLQKRQISVDELLINFKAALSSRCSHIIQSMWEYEGSPLKHAVLQLGEEPLKELIQSVLSGDRSSNGIFINKFLSLISNRSVLESILQDESEKSASTYQARKILFLQARIEELKLMQNSSTLLDFAQNGASNQQPMQKGVSELLKNFTTVLHSRNNNSIQTMWKENPELASYFSGQSVLQSSQINADEWITHFKSVLASNNASIIDAMWKGNPVFASYFSGKPTEMLIVNAGGLALSQLKQISIDERIVNFKSVLSSYKTTLIKSIWNDNPELASYFSGKSTEMSIVNAYGQIEKQQMQISTDKLIGNFKAALAARCYDVLSSMWEGADTPLRIAVQQMDEASLKVLTQSVLSSDRSGNSKFIMDFLSSILNLSMLEFILQEITAGASASSYQKNKMQCLQTRIEELRATQKTLTDPSVRQDNSLSLQGPDTMPHRLFRPKSLQVAVFNRPKTTNQQLIERNIDTLVDRFTKVLPSRCTDSITTIWKVDPELADYFSGKLMSVSVIDANGHTQLQTRKISAKEWTALFKSVLSSHCTAVIVSMWEGNPEFASYFIGKAIKVSVVNRDRENVVHTEQITIDDLVANFKAVLSSQCASFIKLMWKENPELAGYFSGKPLEVSVVKADRHTEKQTKPISDDILVANFKSVLASGCSSVIQLMWVNVHSSIERVVKNMNEESQKELIKCVFSGVRRGQSEVIPDFLRLISNLPILESILQETPVGASASRYNIARKNFLEARIEELKPTQKRLCDDSVTNNTMFKKPNSSSSNQNKRFKKDDKMDNRPQGPK